MWEQGAFAEKHNLQPPQDALLLMFLLAQGMDKCMTLSTSRCRTDNTLPQLLGLV